MKQVTEEQKVEVELRFQALWEYYKKIDAYKDEIKMVTSSMNDTFKALTDSLEVEPQPLKKAFKEWIEKKTNKDAHDEKDEILELISDCLENK